MLIKLKKYTFDRVLPKGGTVSRSNLKTQGLALLSKPTSLATLIKAKPFPFRVWLSPSQSPPNSSLGSPLTFFNVSSFIVILLFFIYLESTMFAKKPSISPLTPTPVSVPEGVTGASPQVPVGASPTLEEVAFGKPQKVSSASSPSPWSHTSEFVSLGHPDRVADTIAAGIIDAFSQKQHTAIECAISYDSIFLFGESPISSDVDFDVLEQEVEQSFKSICGYSDEHAVKFTTGTVCKAPQFDRFTFNLSFANQSTDIAIGAGPDLQNPGWGDQGIFCGYSSSLAEFHNLHPSHWFAMSLTDFLFRKTDSVDIKCLVSTTPTSNDVPLKYLPENTPKFIITKVVVAAPVPNHSSHNAYCDYIRSLVREWAPLVEAQFLSGGSDSSLSGANPSGANPSGANPSGASILSPETEIVVNGTGSFRLHGPLADSGLTGRKLAIHLYGGVAPVGGGSLVKYPRSADLLLNLLARKLAVTFTSAPLVRERFPDLPVCVNLSAVIGSTRLNSVTVNPAPGFSVPEVKKADWDSIVNQFLQFVYSLDLSPRALLDLWGFEDTPQLREIYTKDFFGPRAHFSSEHSSSGDSPSAGVCPEPDWFNWELPFEFVPVL